MDKSISEILAVLKGLSDDFYSEFNVGGKAQPLETSRVTFAKSLETKGADDNLAFSPLYTIAKSRLFRIWEGMSKGQSVLLAPIPLVRNEVKTDLWFCLAKTAESKPTLYLSEKNDPLGELTPGFVFETSALELEEWAVKNAAEYPLGKSLVTESLVLNLSFLIRFAHCPWVFSAADGLKGIPALNIVLEPLEVLCIASNNEVAGISSKSTRSEALLKDTLIKMNLLRLVSYFYTEAFIREEARERKIEGTVLRNDMVGQMPFEPNTSTWVRSILDFKKREVRGSSTMIECATMMSENKTRLVEVGIDLAPRTFRSTGTITGYLGSEKIVAAKSGFALSERDNNGFGYVFRDETKQDLVVSRTTENQELLLEAAQVLTEEVGPLNSCSYELMAKEVFCSGNFIKIVEAAKPSIRNFCNQLNDALTKRPEKTKQA